MKLNLQNAIGVMIDFQEKLAPAIYENQEIIENTAMFVKGLQELEVPFLVTQQYTKGLGETVAPIKDVIPAFTSVEKTSFSCCGAEEFVELLKKSGKDTVLVTGIEAHICVMQTVIDLLEAGMKVFVVADCVGSRKAYNKNYAIDRMLAEGAFITTAEAALFEMTGGAKSPHFKAISKLVK